MPRVIGYQRLLLGLLALVSVPASAEQCKGPTGCPLPVTFKGTFLEETCEVKIDQGGNQATVVLPRISTRLLQKDGDEAGARQFSISLATCPAGKNINLYFTPINIRVNQITGNLMNSSGYGMSEFVELRLRDESGQQLRVGDNTYYQQYSIPQTSAEVTHTYSASYFANGNNAVTAGSLNTLAGINLIYN